MTDPDLPLLARLMEATIAAGGAGGRVVRDVGGFAAAVHPGDDMIYLSTALPRPATAEADFSPATVDALRAFFREHRRVLRFEFFEPLHPWLAGRLEGCGLKPQGAMPLMICRPGGLRPPAGPAGVTVHDLPADADDATFRQFLTTAMTAFGEPPDAPAAAVEAHRQSLRDGVYRCAFATVEGATGDGAMVGVGSMSVGNDELVGIGTLPAHRRRGVAAAVSSHLVADHFRRGGGLCWLSAGDDVARAAYAKIGFREAGVQLNYIEADWDGRTRAGGGG